MDDLKAEMETKSPYTIISLTDKVMGIDTDNIPDRKNRSKHRSRFIAQIAFPFPVGIVTVERPGSMGNWVAVFRMNHGDNTTSPDFMTAAFDAAAQAPAKLSRRQTADAVNSIAFATGRNKNLCKAILTAVLPDGTVPTFLRDQMGEGEERFVQDAANLILCADSREELDMLTDMRRLNCRGNTEESEFKEFWAEMMRVSVII